MRCTGARLCGSWARTGKQTTAASRPETAAVTAGVPGLGTGCRPRTQLREHLVLRFRAGFDPARNPEEHRESYAPEPLYPSHS